MAMAGLPQTWDAPPAAPSMQAPQASWGQVQAPQLPAPIAPVGRLQVYSEDCEDPMQGQSPTQKMPGPRRNRPRQEVYVQDLRDSGRFRPVSNRKALTQPPGKRDRPEVLSDAQMAATLHRAFGKESLILLDPDAAFLEASDPSDSDVAKLLSNVWQCQVLASVCCALCQALLAGLSIASLLLVTLPTEELLAFSARLWPFFGGALLILSEVCTFGSVLSVARLLWILQARTGDEPPSGVRRRLLFAVLHATLNTSLLALLAVVSCQVTWPESQIFLVEGLLGLAALLLSLPEAVQLMSSSPRRVFDK